MDVGEEDPVLENFIRLSQEYSAEFPVMLANHLPMVMYAMRRMGAGDERLGAFFAHYVRENGLVPLAEPELAVTPENFRDGLGDRRREADYRLFFSELVKMRGAESVAREYLPVLMPGFAASALHAFMRIAYAAARGDEQEIAISLGYWAACYLELGRSKGAPRSTAEPLDTLQYMYEPPSFRHIVPESDLLWHNMMAVAAEPDFGPVVDMLEIRSGSLPKMAGTSLVLFASTMDFCALHAVTGCHWMRMMDWLNPDPESALRYFWQGITALVPKIGFPGLMDEEELVALRKAKAPDWREIFRVAVESNDEHDLSLTFSASEEEKVYRDPLYRILAAKRLNLT